MQTRTQVAISPTTKLNSSMKLNKDMKECNT